MSEAEKRAVVRDWNTAQGWGFIGDTVGSEHDQLLACAERAIEREFHLTGCAELLAYHGITQ